MSINEDITRGEQESNRDRRGHRGGTGPDRTDQSYTGHGRNWQGSHQAAKRPEKARCPYCTHKSCKSCMCCSMGLEAA